jgi:hypothetical protein
MPKSKRGGNADVVTKGEGVHKPSGSDLPQIPKLQRLGRTGIMRQADEGKVLKNLNLELSTKNKKGSSRTPSSKNKLEI